MRAWSRLSFIPAYPAKKHNYPLLVLSAVIGARQNGHAYTNSMYSGPFGKRSARRSQRAVARDRVGGILLGLLMMCLPMACCSSSARPGKETSKHVNGSAAGNHSFELCSSCESHP
jgi:hypothetical protein